MRLSNTGLLFLTIFMLLSASTQIFGAPFTPGNIVVCRVGGDAVNGPGGAALTSAATAVFLDEYAPAGTYVQSIALPTTDSGANQTLTMSGSSTSDCEITRSVDGRYILITGYDAAVGTLAVTGTSTTGGTPVVRVIGRVDFDGNVDTTTTTTGYSANNIRSAASPNGTDIWTSGANTGVSYQTFGSNTSTVVSTTVVNTRGLNIFGSQLYTSSSSGAIRVATVGTGLPTTTGQTITNLPGFLTTGSPYGYFLADLSSSEAGLDTLYVADDGSGTGAAGGGVKKFSLVAGVWTYNGTTPASASPVIPATTFFGLTGRSNGNAVTLFATRASGQLVSITDTTGYNAFVGLNLLPNAPTLLATAPLNTAYRGIASAPVNPTAASGVISGRVLTANGIGINKVRLTLQSADSNESRVVVTNPFGYYTFDDLSLGENYIISVQSKKYAFAQPVQAVNLIQSLEEVNFTAEPNFAERESTERKSK